MSLDGAVKGKVPEPCVRRLSGYHRILEELERNGSEVVSSSALARLAGINPAQVRKDLSYFGSFGKRGSGYPVPELRTRILGILGLNRRWKVALIGAGNLGHALFSHKEFARYGFDIVAIFDTDPGKIGELWEGVPISALEDCERILADSGAQLAVVATPAASAQEVVERLARAGISGILNFAPRKVETAGTVRLRNVNLTVELEGLTFSVHGRRK